LDILFRDSARQDLLKLDKGEIGQSLVLQGSTTLLASWQDPTQRQRQGVSAILANRGKQERSRS